MPLYWPMNSRSPSGENATEREKSPSPERSPIPKRLTSLPVRTSRTSVPRVPGGPGDQLAVRAERDQVGRGSASEGGERPPAHVPHPKRLRWPVVGRLGCREQLAVGGEGERLGVAPHAPQLARRRQRPRVPECEAPTFSGNREQAPVGAEVDREGRAVDRADARPSLQGPGVDQVDGAVAVRERKRAPVGADRDPSWRVVYVEAPADGEAPVEPPVPGEVPEDRARVVGRGDQRASVTPSGRARRCRRCARRSAARCARARRPTRTALPSRSKSPASAHRA